MEEKSLYICSLEARMVDYDIKGCYSIQAIDLTEVLSFDSDESDPITISFDRSRQPTKKPAQDKLREVDSLRGNSVPYRMSFGVFGSQIVLSCGFDIRERCCSDVYVLETNPKLPRGKKLSVIKAKPGKSKAKGSQDFNIPPLNSPKGLVKLMEIQGKLYALDLDHHRVPSYTRPYVFFEVFDAKTGLWASLPDPPRQILKTKERLSCLVVGTKIFLFSRTPVFYYFDVAEPTGPWRSYGKTRLGSDAFHKILPLEEPMVLDLEEDNSMLLLSHYMESIHVFQIKLSDPVCLDYVATIEVITGFEPFSSAITHLGGLKVCFVSGGISAYGKVAGVIFTFEISSSNSATSSTTPSSSSCSHDDDSYFRIIYPDIRSNGTSSFFSAKSLGWRTFQYSWQREDGFPLYAPVIGLAVLPLHHRDQALCRRCRMDFGNTKQLKYHLSISQICRYESCRYEKRPQVQCKFCRLYFSKKELVSHFQTSLDCNSKFTGKFERRDKELMASS